MKRLILVLCILLSFVFVGCNSNQEDQQEFNEIGTKYKQAMDNYNQTHDKKYLDEATNYLKQMKKITDEKF